MLICSTLVAGMKRARSSAGPRPGAGALRAIVRVALSALWLTAGVGAGAVAADGVTPIGTYATMHDSGGTHYAIDLWRTAESVVGVFHDFEGPENGFGALIEQVSYDEKTGHLAFTARLSIGDVVLRVGPDKQISQVPSRDVFTFDGRLGTTGVTGTLKHVDEANPRDRSRTERITLERYRVEKPWQKLSPYPSVADWRREQGEIYRQDQDSGGPKQ